MQSNHRQAIPISPSSNNEAKVKGQLEKAIQSSLSLTTPFKKLSFSAFDFESETDQWHFTLKLELPIPQECKEVKIGEEKDRRNRMIADFIRNARIELFQAIKSEIGHMYFVASIDEYRLITPLLPQHIATYNADKSKWILLNDSERTALKTDSPELKSMIDYSETVLNKNMFIFDEKNKEQPFSPLIYTHIEAEYSFILSNMTFQYYLNEKRKNAKR